MTENEVAEIIIKQYGNCIKPISIDCDDCPAERIRKEKGLDRCGNLWGSDFDKKKQWFENLLKENGDKMKTEKIKELREKLKNITDQQLETIADIIYDKVVDHEQHIIDAFNEFKDRFIYTDEECSFAEKVKENGSSPKPFYAGFKAGEKYGEKYKNKGTLR